MGQASSLAGAICGSGTFCSFLEREGRIDRARCGLGRRVVRGSGIEQSSVLRVLEVELRDNGIEVNDNVGELGMDSPKLERDFVAQQIGRASCRERV